MNGCNDNGKAVFIPICTRDLFTKTYSYLTKEDAGAFFTANDMDDYKKYIKGELQNYLISEMEITEQENNARI